MDASKVSLQGEANQRKKRSIISDDIDRLFLRLKPCHRSFEDRSSGSSGMKGYPRGRAGCEIGREISFFDGHRMQAPKTLPSPRRGG